jgi:uncharacterized cupin superfamily protein
VTNVFEPEFESESDRDGFRYRRARIGWQVGSERLGASLYDVPPGQATFPYHWHSANEEMLIVLSGRPSLRTADGWRELADGEVIAFAVGEEGAHQVANWSDEPVRFLVVSEMNAPDVNGYPDTGKVGVLTRPPGSRDKDAGLFEFFMLDDSTEYWEGEPRPERPDGGG